jgi:hypothetical protein
MGKAGNWRIGKREAAENREVGKEKNRKTERRKIGHSDNELQDSVLALEAFSAFPIFELFPAFPLLHFSGSVFHSPTFPLFQFSQAHSSTSA